MNQRDILMIGLGGLLGASMMGWALAQSPTETQAKAPVWTITKDANSIKAGQYLTVKRTGERVDPIHVDVRELCKSRRQ